MTVRCKHGGLHLLTTGTVTGCLAIPPYVTIDPPNLGHMAVGGFYNNILSQASDIGFQLENKAFSLEMAEEFCCAFASNSIQCQFRLWTVLLTRRKNTNHCVFHEILKPYDCISSDTQTLNSSFISGRLSVSSLITCVAPMSFSRSLSCVNSGL